MALPKNKYNPSQLVSLDILNLLEGIDSVILRCAGKAHTNTFDDNDYVPGMTVGYQVAGIPPVHRGEKLVFSPYEQRTLYITANTKRWYFSVTHAFNQTDDVFYMNRELVAETISAPTLKALKETIEFEGTQWLAEHSPIIPAYGTPQNQQIVFKDYFNFKVINYLEKLRRDLVFPTKSYKLILNTRDDMLLANSLQNMYNEQINKMVTEMGAPPSKVAGFTNESSPYMGLHITGQGTSTNRGALRFRSLPSDESNPLAELYNTTGSAIDLKGGDIIYHVAAGSAESQGLFWIQNTIKRAIPDSRYAFCITSSAYIDAMSEADMETFSYDQVRYRINANSSTLLAVKPNGTTVSIPKISVSHVPIPSGYHQNCSREIVTGTTSGDTFYILQNHYKNFAAHPEFFKFKCFKLPALKSTEHAYVDDGKRGVNMLITHDRVLAERSKRGNIFDVSALPCFGSVSQNLFTLPTKEEITDSVGTISESGYRTQVSMPQEVPTPTEEKPKVETQKAEIKKEPKKK